MTVLLMFFLMPITTGCVKQGEYIVENRRMISGVYGDMAELAEAIANNDIEKIIGVGNKAKSKQLAINKSADKIQEQLRKNWFTKLWEGTLTFFSEGGVDVVINAGKNILTQNWGGLVMGLVAGVVEYMRRREKKQKQEYACAINEIAHEPDEKVRQAKLIKTFDKRKKNDKNS